MRMRMRVAGACLRASPAGLCAAVMVLLFSCECVVVKRARTRTGALPARSRVPLRETSTHGDDARARMQRGWSVECRFTQGEQRKSPQARWLLKLFSGRAAPPPPPSPAGPSEKITCSWRFLKSLIFFFIFFLFLLLLYVYREPTAQTHVPNHNTHRAHQTNNRRRVSYPRRA